MRTPIPRLAAALAAALCSACVTTPPQTRNVAEGLRGYSRELGHTHLETVERYHDRLVEVNDAWLAASLARVDEHESDVRVLARRLEELGKAYAAVAAGLEQALDAEPGTTRAELFDPEEAARLSVALASESERSVVDDAVVESILRSVRAVNGSPEGYLAKRKRLEAMHAAVAAQARSTHDGLRERLLAEYADLDAAFDDLDAMLLERVPRREERRRVLGQGQRTAESLEERAREPEPLSAPGELDEVFGAGVEDAEQPDPPR